MDNIENEEDYSPYCKLCTSCGEDGCCSYLMCVNTVLDANKDCGHYNATKFEMYLRDVFMERMLSSNLNEEFIGKIYEESYDEAKKLLL